MPMNRKVNESSEVYLFSGLLLSNMDKSRKYYNEAKSQTSKGIFFITPFM